MTPQEIVKHIIAMKTKHRQFWGKALLLVLAHIIVYVTHVVYHIVENSRKMKN